MPNCKCCGKPVINGVVLHSECYTRPKTAAKMYWRPVSEPPNTPNQILVEADMGVYKDDFYSEAVFVYDAIDGVKPGIFCSIDGEKPVWLDENGAVLEAATHWMPFPSPPKEDGGV